MFLLILATSALANPPVEVGDIVFHESTSSQSAQIQAATNSRYSHVGVIVSTGERPMVLEGVQPVKLTPLDSWIDRGVDDHVAIRRPKQALTAEQKARIATVGLPWLGRPYDGAFQWDDERLYCSELVYKLYLEATGLEVGQRRAVSEFHVDSPQMLEALKARGIALETRVVSPADILDDDDLHDPRAEPAG